MTNKVVKTTVTTIKEAPSKKKKRKTLKKKTTKKAIKKKPVKKSVKRKPAKKSVKRRRSNSGVNSATKKILELTQKSLERVEKRDNLLIENFVGLQKAMATLSVKFSELSQNMGTMLKIFEEAAKILAQSEKQVDKTLTTKLDSLIEQNKSLSRELGLMDSKMRRSTAKPTPQALYTRQMAQPTQPIAQSLPPKQIPQP